MLPTRAKDEPRMMVQYTSVNTLFIPYYSVKAINFLCPTGCATACELIVSHDLCNYVVKHGCQKAGSSPKYVL